MTELNAKKISSKLDSVSFLLDDLSQVLDDCLCIDDSYRLFIFQSKLVLDSLDRLSKQIDSFCAKIVNPRLL